MVQFSPALQDYSPNHDAVHARDSVRVSDLSSLVKTVLSSPSLDSRLAEITVESQPGRVWAGVIQNADGTEREVTVIVVQPPAANPCADAISARFGLTPRETEVALLLAKRLSAKEIARQLGFTRFAANRHTEQILGKLGVRSRREVAPLFEGFAWNAA